MVSEQPVAEWHIASLVVHARPSRVRAIEQAVNALDGAEVRADDGRGKLVVLLETADEAQMLSRFRDIEHIEGVLGVALVFHQIDAA